MTNRRKRGQGGNSKNVNSTPNNNPEFNSSRHNIEIIVAEVIVSAIGCGIFAIIDTVTTSDWSWLRFWFWLSLAYIVLTPRWWATIPADQLAVRTRFGEPIDILSSGLPFIPPGIYDLIPFTTRTKNFEAPTEPEKIFRAKEGMEQTPPPGMKPPIRVTFRSAISDEEAKKIFGEDEIEHVLGQEFGEYCLQRPDGKLITFRANAEDDGLNKKRLTTEITPVVRWRICDAIKFVKNIGSQEEVERQIEDEMVSVLARICPQISASQAKANMEWLNELLRRAVERRVSGKDADRSDGWGIEIEGAYLKPISFNHSLNSEIAGVVEAGFKKESTITGAEGERKKRELEGKGAAVAARELEQRTLEGRGKGYAALAKQTGLTGQEAARLDTARSIGEGDGTIILGEAGVAGLAAIAGAILPKVNKSEKKNSQADEPAEEKTTDESA